MTVEPGCIDCWFDLTAFRQPSHVKGGEHVPYVVEPGPREFCFCGRHYLRVGEVMPAVREQHLGMHSVWVVPPQRR